MIPRLFFSALLSGLLLSCASVDYEGASSGPLSDESGRVLLAPFGNATSNGSAGVALTEQVASALSAAGLAWGIVDEAAAGDPILETAGRRNFTYLITGTVHEYAYKTDLNGDPAVGASATLWEVASGRVVWQGSASATGAVLSSLSEAGQKVAVRLVDRMLQPGFLGM